MNTFCTACGEALVPEDRFCSSCGAPVEDLGASQGGSADAPAAPVGGPDEQSPAGGSQPSLARRWQQQVGSSDLVKDVRTAATQELAKAAAIRTVGSWLLVWAVIAVFSQLGVVIIDTGELEINGASLASVIMALGFGGSVAAEGSGGFGFLVQGEGSLVAHSAPFIVAIAYAIALRLAFTFKAVGKSESETIATGLISAVCAGAVTLVSTIFGSTTISGLLDEQSGVEATLGLTWLLPVLLAMVLTGLVVTAPVLTAGWMRLRSSVRDLVGVLGAVTCALFIAGLAAVFYYGVRIGTGALEVDIPAAIGWVVGALLLLPNAVISALSLLMGAQGGYDFSVDGDTSIVRSLTSDLPSESDTYGLPALVVLLALGVLLLALVALWRVNSARESKSAWWENALTFGVVGLFLTYFGNLHASAVVNVGSFAGSASADATYIAGFNAFEVGLRFAVIGLIVGAARHPVVLEKLRPVGEPVDQLVTPLATALVQKSKVRELVARLAQIPAQSEVPSSIPEDVELSAEVPSVGSEDPSDFTRTLRGLVVTGLCACALLVVIPASLIVGKGLLVASGVVTDSPSDIVSQVEETIRNGDGQALSDLIGISGESRILSSTTGATDVVGSLEGESYYGYQSGEVRWRVGDVEASSPITIYEVSESNFFGLLPAWELGDVPGLPSAYGTTLGTDGVTTVLSAVRVDGEEIPADRQRTVMPGTLDAGAVASSNPGWVTGAVNAPVQAVGGAGSDGVAIPVTYSMTPAGSTEAVASASRTLVGCTTDSSPDACPSPIACWVPSPADPAVYATPLALGPNNVVVPLVPGALKYGNTFFGTCTPDRSLEGSVDLTVTGTGMAARE